MSTVTAGRTTILSFISENIRWLGAGFLLTFASSFGQTYFIAFFSADIRAEFDLSHGDYGTLYMVATLASAATLVWLGKFVDNQTVRVAGLITLFGLAAAMLTMAAARSVLVLGVGLYLCRLFGQGMCGHVALTGVGRWYRANRGRAVSIANLGHPAGEAVFPITAVAIIAYFGWRATWASAFVLLVFAAIPVLFLLLASERKPQSTASSATLSDGDDLHQWTRAEILRDWRFWAMQPGILCMAYFGTGIIFHQVHLMEVKGWSVEWFAANFPIYAAMTVVSALVTGEVVDRLGAIRLLPFITLPMAMGCLFIGLGDSPVMVPVFMLFIGVSGGNANTVFGALWPEIYGTKHLGAVRSLIFAAMVFASALAPGVMGMLIDFGVSIESQIVGSAIYMIGAFFGLMLLAPKLAPRRISGSVA